MSKRKLTTMEIAPIQSNSAVAVAVKALETTNALQMEVLKTMADGQQQMAALLQEIGVGQAIDIMA
jgi:hypothetical protein